MRRSPSSPASSLLHLFDRIVATKVCDRPPSETRSALGLVPLIGIGFHSFLDEIAYSVGFSVGAMTGLLMALGTVLHESPEGIVTYTLLLCSGFTRRRAVMLTLLVAAVSTPLGTVLSYPLVDRPEPSVLGWLLSLPTGALLYVGASHLIPQISGERAGLSCLRCWEATVAVLITLAGG